MRDTFHDLETYSPEPINNGSHRYAEKAEVLLWAYADGNGDIRVWDVANGYVHWQEELTGLWEEQYIGKPFPPQSLTEILHDPEAAVWFHNGGMFDFVVLQHAMPELLKLVDISRWRDTMVQAFAHALPGALEKLGEVLNLHEDHRKIAEGKKLVRLFCMPQNEDFSKKFGTIRASKATHPAEWQRFVQYAGGDIVTMREARRLMPSWNYKDKQLLLWHTDLKINNRGFAVDLELAKHAVTAATLIQDRLSRRVQVATDDEVGSATQRDAMLDFLQPLCAEFGVELPDLKADTLERRLEDPDLPDYIKDLLRIRLEASMNSVSKFKTLLKRVSSDGRLRGSMQFRGAGRTGRWAHRGFQPGNLPRPSLSHELIEFAIECIKADDVDAMELVFPNLMLAISNTIRGAIVAAEGKKLVVADLSNIEGRVAAWLAGEDWKLEAFRQFDKGIGHDLYIVAYASSFGISLEGVEPKDGKKFIGASNRQIGKVEELMFQYGGGVGAWLTGAATYGIDLSAMTESVWNTIPEWAKLEAADFLHWLYEKPRAKFQKVCEKYGDPTAPEVAEAEAALEAAKVKCRYGLTERVFIACDAIKRLWRKAHPAISSYWKDLENTVKAAIDDPGVTYPCRKVKIRRDGAWLRIGLPSGRALCYPNPGIDKDGSIFYTGFSPYNRQWGKVKTYGGKLLENITQAVACDQLAECMPAAELAGYATVLSVHDELVTETPDSEDFTADELASIMCSDLGWNAGLPLAAAGFTTDRYRKAD
jgi:DNA polymerase